MPKERKMDNQSRNDLVLFSPPSPPINRSKGLQKLGVSEDDVNLAKRLLEQIPACPSDPNKAERILGYASTRLLREKALRLLGATEEEVDAENAKTLGSLGVAGRRRSFSIETTAHSEFLAFTKVIPKSSDILRRRHTHAVHLNREVRQRRNVGKRNMTFTETEVRTLHSQAKESANQMREMRAKISELERRLTLAGTDTPACSDNNGAATPSLITA